jgi:predicted molibdopterin-dependent oxidoreductase YjgC
MLVDPGETVVLRPAATRYEQEGGGTSTTTERRVAFSPELPGPRVGEARSEWRIFGDVARRVRPDLAETFGCESGDAIRAEIARVVPSYAGIETLRTTGDQVQYGGPLLCTDGRFERPGERARFSVLAPVEAPGPARAEETAAARLRLTTRRGKQFNSMVHADRDPLTGARREDILVSAEDAAARGLADGDPIVVRSAHGAFRGRARIAPLRAGNVQGFWPEVNGLLALDRRDAASGVPDYGAEVTIEPGGTT